MTDETSDDSGDGGAGAQPKPKKVTARAGTLLKLALPVERTVSSKHLENLRASGLTDETIKLANLYTEVDPSKLAKLVERTTWPRQCGNGLVFPFYYPTASDPHAYRIRPTTPRPTGKTKRDGTPKVAKYDQATSHGSLTYFTPRASAAGCYVDVGQTLFWTEGEKKALVFDQMGLVCVGLTGVWNWTDSTHRDEAGDRLDPRIAANVSIAGRHHVIVYDADSRTNDDVMRAAGRLCGILTAMGALSIKFVCPLSLETKGIDDYYKAHGDDITRQLLASAETIEPIDPKEPLTKLRTIKHMREAPLPMDMRLPQGYAIERDGALWKVGDDKLGDVKIARSPIVLSRYLDDYYTHEGRVDVCFERDERWVTICVARKTIVDSRSMVAELSSFGAPVTSNNAARLVDWIDELERVNVGRVPRIACVSKTGWHTIDGHQTFVIDAPVFATSNTDHPPLDVDTRGDRKKLFGSLKSSGNVEKHLTALKRAWEADPIAAVMICGALAAPLLQHLNAPNFAIHLPGDSSRGKTTMLKIAASVYGDPNDNHWVAPWATTVGAELRAAVLNDLPNCYDEVGTSDAQQIERSIYMLVNGGGKPRGQRDLTMRETPSWRTIVLSTGERELATSESATGAQIRVIQMFVSGFGSLGALQVDELRDACIADAGAFGREWISALLDVDDWEGYRQSYRSIVKQLREQASDPLQQRLSGYFGVLAMAEHMASHLGLGQPGGVTMRRQFMIPGAVRETESAAQRARGAVIDWARREPDSFPSVTLDNTSGAPRARTTHAREIHGYKRDGVLLLIPAAFREFCAENNFSDVAVLRGWAEHGWLRTEGKHLAVKVLIGEGRHRYHVLNAPEFVDSVESDSPETGDVL